MVQNNKVLTVSYGTFSCTLEGFEDSFGAMKAIAEYFRDLAADDRYFGAEPPQPDADMLARIAQREVARQVEARADGAEIHLRAAQPDAVPSAPPVAEPEVAPVAEREVTATPVAISQPAPQPDPVVETVEEPVAEATQDPITEAGPEAEDDSVSAQDDATDSAQEAELTGEPTAEAVEETAAADTLPEAPAALEAEEGEALLEDVTPAPSDSASTPANDSIAAKLQRIRDVVARGSNEEAEDYDEDYTSESQSDEAPEAAAIDIASVLAEELSEASDDVLSETDEEAAHVLDHLDLTGSVESAKAAEDLDLEEFQDDEAQDEDSLFGGLGDDDIATEEDTNILEDAPAPEETTAPLRARIIRVKRSKVAEEDAEPAVAATSEEEPTTSLSQEDEAELMAELAAVEAELRDSAEPEDDIAEFDEEEDEDFLEEDISEDVHFEDVAVTEEPILEQEQPVEPRAAAPAAAETDVSRLMAAAEEKLDDPENAVSRETYSRLRAAVAAAEVERAAGASMSTEDDGDAYREDLASIVRPRRPEASSGRTPRRPEPAERPSPLKLVAEQRVDTEDSVAPAPVRPRRVASVQAAEAEFEDMGAEGGFAAYAEESGAVELNELLEAAASYMSFVEGRDQFTRPQLMNKVQQLESTDFNREDGLRSFGLLLREGKIERTQGGRFTAAGDIGFRPGERAAG